MSTPHSATILPPTSFDVVVARPIQIILVHVVNSTITGSSIHKLPFEFEEKLNAFCPCEWTFDSLTSYWRCWCAISCDMPFLSWPLWLLEERNSWHADGNCICSLHDDIAYGIRSGQAWSDIFSKLARSADSWCCDLVKSYLWPIGVRCLMLFNLKCN